MESSLDTTAPAASATDAAPAASTLSARLAGWMSTAERRLRIGGEWPLAGALREGLELAAEELRVEQEARQEAGCGADARLARYSALLEEVPVALLATDATGRVSEANRLAARLCGDPRDGIAGKLLVRYVALEDRRIFRVALAELASARWGAGVEPAVRELPFRLRPASGRPVDVVATVRAVADGGACVLYWALREDRSAAAGDLL